jgi:ABC-type dipeptide/oligopeptide/nickel transport system ATPase subunit
MMKKYSLSLKSDMSQTFLATRAANSVDLNIAEKSLHEFSVSADFETPFSIGLIVGSSGSGKTTLARHVFGEFGSQLDKARAVIDQFPAGMPYDAIAGALNGIGLSSVPQWLKPAGALSNGQQARSDAALAMAYAGSEVVVIDEWTSVVDRTVAKVMSHCVQKYARRNQKRIILVSCHYDVIEWLDPDWIVDCNSQRYVDRRSLQRSRSEQLHFDLREVSSSTWKNFSKYHYLSNRLPPGRSFYYGLFLGRQQIGFQCFANYVPIRANSIPIYHSNRTVIHPDYAGLGCGLKMVNAAARHLKGTHECKIMAKFSAEPMYRARLRDAENWELMKTERIIGHYPLPGKTMDRKSGFRENVKTWTFRYIGS